MDTKNRTTLLGVLSSLLAAQVLGASTQPATKDYLRNSVSRLFHTYPKLKGLGMCPGEHFGELNKDHDFKEQWCWDVDDSEPRADIEIARKEHP